MWRQQRQLLEDEISSSDTDLDAEVSEENVPKVRKLDLLVAEKKWVAIEVFAGSARLTRALAAAGFDACGIDYNHNKDKPVAKVSWVDRSHNGGPCSLAVVWNFANMKRQHLP